MPHVPDPASRAARLARLNDDLLVHAQEAPPDGARPLEIAGRRCGWITEAARDALLGTGLAETGEEAVRLAPGLAPGPALDAALAKVAQTLHDAHCLRSWRNELLDVYAGDARLGAIERGAVRALGLPTRAVHLNGWTPDGRLWVARRALDKATDPGMWDTLVGGLVGSREDLDLALERECAEEAGLEPLQLRGREPLRSVFRMRRRLPEGYQVEELLVSTCVLAADTRPTNRDGEVMEITALAVDDAIARIEAGDFTLEAALMIVDDIARRAP
jgi:8-oxo-dGTP pyrophosphatase MutT (NUDIX family)